MLVSQPTSEKLSLFGVISNVTPKRIPEPPNELIDFRNTPKYQKYKDSEKFYKQEFIQVYLEDKWQAERFNRDCFLWLWEGYQNIKDPVKIAILRTKMAEFRKAMIEDRDIFEALKLDFNKFKFYEPPTAEEKKVCDTFGGKIVQR